jgi:hypothetical protein
VYRGRRVGFSFGDNMFVGMPGLDHEIHVAPMVHIEMPEPPEPLDPPEPPVAPAPPTPERGPSSSGDDLATGTIDVDVNSILDHARETLRSLQSDEVDVDSLLDHAHETLRSLEAEGLRGD